MKRKLDFSISEQWDHKSLLDFLKDKGFSRKNIIDLKKTENGILVNGKWEYVNYILKPGDLVTITIIEEESSDKIIPVLLSFSIVYEDEDILVVNKPANMPIHPSMNNYNNTLANAIAYYFKTKGQKFVFRCVNRLDRDTSGLTIIAKHSFAANQLNRQMLQREIKREYLAIVDGIIPNDRGRIEARIGRVDGSTIERRIDEEHGEYAVTNYKVVKRLKGHTLISLNLETGRTHQIRVHMKSAGYPLVGDFLYHNKETSLKRQALHSYSLNFRHPITGNQLLFKAHLPKDMEEYLQTIGNI